jgi:hypothetical protein
MATKTVVTMHDDLTDEAADTTVSFGLDGRDYEIGLTDANAEVGCFAISGLASMRLSGCELVIEVLVVNLLRGPVAECRV